MISAGPGATQEEPDSIVDLLSAGELRVALFTNTWSPSLVTLDPQTGEVVGVGADLARALADRMGVPVAWVKYPGLGAIVTAFSVARQQPPYRHRRGAGLLCWTSG